MPWTEKQLKLFRAAAHNPAIAKSSGIKQSDAERMSKEGLKKMSTGGINQINQQQTRSGSINGARKRLPSVSLNKFAGLKSGGMMKTRKFAEAGIVDDSDMNDDGAPISKYEIDPDSRRAHGLYNEAPAAKAPATKPVATRNPETERQKARSEGNSSGFKPYQPPADKSSSPAKAPASPTAAKNTEVSRGLGGSFTPEERAANRESAAQGVKKAASSFGNYFKDLVTKTRAERYKEANPDKKFAKGGMMKNLFKGKETYGEELKEAKAIKSGKISPQQYAKGEGMEKTKKYAKGGGIESRGKTKGTMVRMAMGGSVGSASRRADGIAQRGKTKC